MALQIATTKKAPVREGEIRSALLTYITSLAERGSRIHQEFRIERGGARVDLAVIGSKFVGYEIKSDLDTFTRLSNQIHAYNRVFDEIYVVCGAHAVLAEKIVPSWWGILLAERDNDTVHIKIIRNAAKNHGQDPFSLASLLWRDEAVAVLASEEQEVPKKASSHVLWDCISKTLPVDKIKAAVSSYIMKRDDYNKLAIKAM